MNGMYSLFLVLGLVLIALVGVGGFGWDHLFGVYIPAAAIVVFFIGFVVRVLNWGRCAVPFRIPTTCGQAESLPWIKQAKLDNPSTTLGTIGRMVLEVLAFRSLFRNTRMEFHPERNRLAYGSAKWLWLGALAFHYAFLVIVIRHLRLFTEPVPGFVLLFDQLDGMLQIGQPTLYLSDLVILGGLFYLLLRRFTTPMIRYISLPADYFPLFLILGIAISGIFMRYFLKVDLPSIKALTMGIVQLKMVVPEGIGNIFYVHLFLVSILLIYFPFSKLMHFGGVFLSPTRNAPNNSRRVRHINPWNPVVEFHTYDEYEDEFREKMIEAGLPVEKKE